MQELINAVAQNMGIEPSAMCEIDLESLVSGAIKASFNYVKLNWAELFDEEDAANKSADI